MKKACTIALTELQTLFYSPVAWLILIVFAFQSAMTYTNLLDTYTWAQGLGGGYDNYTFRVFAWQQGPQGLFTAVQNYLYLYIPLLTMGLMSRELSSGSIKLLYSSPVSNAQVIFGKYLSMMAYGLVLIAILFVFVVCGSFSIAAFDFPLALSGLLGLYLLICAYAAVGLFMSSVTSYQVVAAIGTLAVLAVLNFIGGVWQQYDFVREITFWLAINGRAGESVTGLICSEDVLYFIIVSGLFLALSITRLKAIRQKSRWQASFAKYTGILVVAMLLGYVTSRPTLMGFYDATRTKQRTLTEKSQEIIRQAKGDLTFTTFVNPLGELYYSGLPSNRKTDARNFAQYIRFKPEMKVKYKYYYANPGSPMLAQRYPGLSDSQIVGRISSVLRLDSTIFMSLDELKPNVDLKGENYRLVRSFERGSGQQSFLRMFDDQQRYPSEAETSAALKRTTTELPVAGFFVGHGSRDCDNAGDRGYHTFSQEKTFRQALVNQGFDFVEVRLDEDLSPRVKILVIADPRDPLSAGEQARLDAYVARGGNLFILGETRRQAAMNTLVEPFGVQFLPGQLVQLYSDSTQTKNNSFDPDFIVSRLAEEGSALCYVFQSMLFNGFRVTMPGCVGLSYTTDKGFEVSPLLTSLPRLGWNELETTDFIDDTVRLNPAIGEVEQSHPTALALSRHVNGKEQKIIIAGDADFLGNGEIAMQRRGVEARNNLFAMGAFYWMSDGEAPVDVRRPPLPDARILVSTDGVTNNKIALMGVFPFLLLASCLVIWLRRRGK
jgi:ABC-2 type transport system permease protein